MAYNEVDLNAQRACVGRLYFHVPGGIQYGNYNLDVQFANSVVRVPMKIMTKEEAKDFDKEWKEESKQEKHKE
jgi:ribosome recycling factor